MTAIHEHQLEGCSPVPLASYLKALGVLRLVAEQADEEATGCWRDERFVLRTKLSRDELIKFFVERYEPSPILSPWNGRAGFLEGEEGEDEDQKSKREGAKLVRSYKTAGDRFAALRSAADAYGNLPVVSKLNDSRARAKTLSKAIEKKKRAREPIADGDQAELSRLNKSVKVAKRATITQLRSGAPEDSLIWFDVCMRIVSDGENTPVAPLLGAGGADGSRDFGMGFGLALGSLFDLSSGAAAVNCERQIRAALFGSAVSSLKAGNVGLFQPAAVGENQSSSFRGELPLNNWDFVLLLEGGAMFAGSASRRLGDAGAARASFPFTVDAQTAGSGATAPSDDKGFAEFWAPLWNRPTSYDELLSFLREGRSTLGRRMVTSGLDFAVAAGALGSGRGVRSFQRHAILVREPQSPRKATALTRISVDQRPAATMATELQPWLSRLKSVAGDGQAGATIKAVLRRVEDALFDLAQATEVGALQAAAETTLVAVGALALEAARRPGLRSSQKKVVPPPPRLSPEWRTRADDGSAEFKLAAAMAGLVGEDAKGRPLPFRIHLTPLVSQGRFDQWSDSTEAKARAVWTGRDLLRDVTAVLVRRLVESQRTEFLSWSGDTELPLRSQQAAPLWAVRLFLDGATDNARLANLAAGLAWVDNGHGGINTRSAHNEPSKWQEDAAPLLYSLLKPMFDPAGVGADPDDPRQVHPLTLLRLLQAGQVEAAARRAQLMARGAGLSTPFLRHALSGARDTRRLAAALAFPIYEWRKLTDRAYPNPSKENFSHADRL